MAEQHSFMSSCLVHASNCTCSFATWHHKTAFVGYLGTLIAPFSACNITTYCIAPPCLALGMYNHSLCNISRQAICLCTSRMLT